MIKDALIRGIKITIPVLLTFLVLYWGVVTVESVFSAIVKPFIPSQYYFPGLGALIGLLFIFFIGTFINAWVVNWIYRAFEKLIHRVPVVSSVYQSIQDFTDMLGNNDKTYGSPVLVEMAGMKLIGLVTCQTFKDLESSKINTADVGIYLPMSYQLGGFFVVVPRTSVTPLNMSVQDAMKFILTAGISKSSKPC